MDRVRVRFAPSPTGFIHVGNARTALFNWLYARQKKGVFILRVEDTDVERSTKEYERRLIEELSWLGLDWDEGPDIGGELGPYKQSQRLEIYQSFAHRLLDEKKAYYCFCTSEELEEERKKALSLGKMPVYGRKCRSIPPLEACRRISAGEQAAATRLITPDSGEIRFHDLIRGALAFEWELIGDPIIVRSNGLPAYNFAVVIDDSLMRISHVIRGEDHIANTPRQLLAYQALSLEPPKFAHLPMVLGKDNARLSKRHGATSVDQFEKEGVLPSALLNYLALLGWAPPEGRETLTESELIGLFNLKKVNRSAAVFDYNKLFWINRQHIKKLPGRDQAELAHPYLKETNLLPENMSRAHWEWLARAVMSLSERVDKLSDLPQHFDIFFDFSAERIKKEAQDILKSKSAKTVIKLFVEKILKTEKFDYSQFADFIREIKKETGLKGANLYHPLRIALTAKTSGLELDIFIPLVEEGSRLRFPKHIKDCSQRAKETLAFLR
ncbi:glutamate--tRNA ligase [Acidobacteriota bacterium]